MNPEIVYEDRDIVVVNKPPGLLVHGGPNIHGQTLVDFLLKKFPDLRMVGDDPATRPGIVHRLDKDTSGIMVVARNQNSFLMLKEIFQNRQVEKKYIAIVCGEVKKKNGIISLPIGRLVGNPVKRGAQQGKKAIRGARDAITEYKIINGSANYTVLELRPLTGRMHQIRVHLKSIGHPIACDTVYGGKKVCCPDGAERQLLHASSISFNLRPGHRVCFEADPPEDFRTSLKIIDAG